MDAIEWLTRCSMGRSERRPMGEPFLERLASGLICLYSLADVGESARTQPARWIAFTTLVTINFRRPTLESNVGAVWVSARASSNTSLNRSILTAGSIAAGTQSGHRAPPTWQDASLPEGRTAQHCERSRSTPWSRRAPRLVNQAGATSRYGTSDGRLGPHSRETCLSDPQGG